MRAVARRQLQDRLELLERRHAGRQPVRRCPGGTASVHGARQLQAARRHDLADVRGAQLPGQRLVERQADRPGHRSGGRLAPLRAGRHQAIKPGATNVLAVEVFPQQKDDLGITFVDWNPTPPDKNMGLWREVHLQRERAGGDAPPGGAVHGGSPANDNAALTVTAVLQERQRPSRSRASCRGRIKDPAAVRFEQAVTLAPGERKDVVFDAGQFPQLEVNQAAAVVAGADGHARPARPASWTSWWVASARTAAGTSFGIREVQVGASTPTSAASSPSTASKILIRGGGWSSDMMMREDPAAPGGRAALRARTWA